MFLQLKLFKNLKLIPIILLLMTECKCLPNLLERESGNLSSFVCPC